MTTYHQRPYENEADLKALLNLVRARPRERLTDSPGLIDLNEMFLLADVKAHTRLWVDAQGELRGYVILQPDFHSVQFEVAPGANDDLARQLVGWAVQYAADNGWEKIRASSIENDLARIALLAESDFTRQEGHTLFFERSLNDPLPPPELSPEFSIRSVEGEQEVEALVALHRAAFGTEYLDVAGRLSWMRSPDYEPALDLVAVAPDGTLAAYMLCHISSEENALTGCSIGYTDPVATHPDYQRLGLAKALLLVGCKKLRERGVETAALGTGSWNTAMRKAAESVGYYVKSRKHFFERDLRSDDCIIPRDRK